jgi:hypothetical protein
VDARIKNIALKDVKLKGEKDYVSVEVVFRHSGESIINGGTSTVPVYYYFRASATDDPVVWGWMVNAEKEKEKTGWADMKVTTTTADEKGSDRDLDLILDKALSSSEKIQYKEYFPSFFSDITLTIDPGRYTSVEITQLVFEVEYLKRHSR